MTGFTTVLLLAVFALYVPLLFVAVWRRPIAGFGLGLLSAVILAFVPELPSTQVMGFNVSVLEGLFGLLGVIGLARLLAQRHAVSLPTILVLAFSVLFAVALLRGVFSFGLDYGRLDFRVHFLFIAAVLFGLSMPIQTYAARRSAGIALLVTAGALTVLVLLRWIWLPSPFGTALHAADALILCQVLVIGLLAWSRGLQPAHLGLFIALLAPIVLLLQIRAVWLAGLAGLAALSLLHPLRLRKIAVLVAAGLVALVLVSHLGLESGRPQFQRGDVFDSLRAAAEDDTTWEWRQSYWGDVVQHHLRRGGLATLVGAGYGHEWVRPSRQDIYFGGPHNFYIELFVRFGLVGLAVFLAMYASVLTGLFRRRAAFSQAILSNEAFTVILLMQIVFYIPYGPSPIQGLLFGMASASISISRVRRDHPSAPAVSQAGRGVLTA